MNANAECPICFSRISTTGDQAANLSLHMSTHSKEEVVAALLGRTRPSQGSNIELVSRISQPVNLSTNVLPSNLSVRQPQSQPQHGMFSVQQGTVVQNQTRPNASNTNGGIPSSGIPLNSFNIINNLASISGTVGNGPKIVPTIAANTFPSSSRATQLLIDNENSNSNDPSCSNVHRNNLVNVQLQQGPILLPPSSNISSSLPQQPVVAALTTPSVTIAPNTSATMQATTSSMNGLMQVMGSTPCLIPQPNGVPIIVNVPTANYVQVPNPSSASNNCNIPLVNSLLAANILANTNILNGGSNGIINPSNTEAIRPTLVTSNNSGLFLTSSGIQPTISSASCSGTPPTLLSYKPASVNNGQQSQQHSNVPVLIGSSVPSLPKDALQRQVSEDSKPSALPTPAGNIQPISLNVSDVERVLIIKNEQQVTNPIFGQFRPQIIPANGDLQARDVMSNGLKSTSDTKTRNCSPSPSTSSDPRYLNVHEGPSTSSHNQTGAKPNKSAKNISKSSNPHLRKSSSKSSKRKESSTTMQEMSRPAAPSNEERKTILNEQMSDRKENTAIQENLTSENSQASAELSLTDNKLDTGRLESKIEIHENPIKDEEPQRKQSLSTPVFGFTQYAADSPYPAASLNFASVLNNLVSPRERVDTKSVDRKEASTSKNCSSPPIYPLSIKQESQSSDNLTSSHIDRNLENEIGQCTIKTEITTEEESLTYEQQSDEMVAGNSTKKSETTSVLGDESTRYAEYFYSI